MKILHILSQTQLTGAETHADCLILEQLKNEHEVYVVSDEWHLNNAKYPVLLYPVDRSNNYFKRKRTANKVVADLIDKQIDIIHCHSRAAVRLAKLLRKKMPCALVTTLHGRQHFSWSKRLFDNYGEYLIAVCTNLKKIHIADFKTFPAKIKVIPNPIVFDKSLDDPQPDRKNKIAFIGRSTGPKGQVIAEFMQQLSKQIDFNNSNLIFDIWAAHPENFPKSLQDLQAQYPKNIKFCGYSKEIQKVYPEYQVVIGAGRVAMESILAKVDTFALGERSCPGFVTSENLEQALQSNFGDISEDETLNYEKSAQEFLSQLNNSQTESLKNLQTKLLEKVESKKVCSQIEEVYKAAIFKYHAPSWTPALMYHKVPDQDIQSKHKIFINKDIFEKHLQFFQRQKFTALSFSDLNDFWELKKSYKEFPKKPLFITFDDGYLDNLENVQPLLKKYQIKANIFLLANHNITENSWDASDTEEPYQLMTLEQKKKLDQKYWHIGSHGLNHKHLPTLTDSEIETELSESKQRLSQDLKCDIVSLAYPYGSTDLRCRNIAAKVGYKFAVNTDSGGMLLSDDPLGIFRVNIFPNDKLFQIWKKTRSSYRLRFFNKHKK